MIPMFFEQIITRFQRRKVLLRIDPLLHNGIAIEYIGNPSVEFAFSLFDFLNAIGYCRCVAPTKSVKFPIALDFLEILIDNNANELRILINDDETIEDKQQISKFAGEGLSLVIAEKLYGIPRTNISRVKRRANESKPDFRGFTPLLKVVWEAKGSINPICQNEIDYAKYQKANEPADIAFASLASLKSDSITEVNLEDPEPLPLEGRELGQRLSRTMHYVSVFNFIGQPKLGRYFTLLGKRLEHDRTFPEYYEKEELFAEIRSRSIRISIKDHNFLGNIERIEESVFLYAGFDEKLLTVQGFLNFTDYEDDFVFRQDNNTFAVSKDGICYGYLRDLGVLRSLGYAKEIDVERISFYRDILSIRDLDDMFNFQLVEQVKYLFEREGFEVSKKVRDSNEKYDLIVSKNGKKYVVEAKKDIIIKCFEELKGFPDINAAFLFTTMDISDEDIHYALGSKVIIIDRKALKAILRKRKSISSLLRSLPLL